MADLQRGLIVMDKKIKIYDLDGTLSTLNSTFDFIQGYHATKKHLIRNLIFRASASLFWRLKLSAAIRRRVLIFLAFVAVRRSSLEIFFNEEYKDSFRLSLTNLGKEVSKQKNSEYILLTGCVAPPAKHIGTFFGFRHVICTKLYFLGDFCSGLVSVDTFREKKGKYIKNYFKSTGQNIRKACYFTDDGEVEQNLCALFDEVVYMEV